MNSHKNARLTRLGRVHLMQQIAHVGLEAAARQVGISKRRAYNGISAGMNGARQVYVIAPHGRLQVPGK